MTTEITDDYMRQRLGQSKAYTAVILRPGPNADMAGRDALVWEHGRRNMRLQADGVLPVVCPVPGGGEVNGIGLFDRTADEVKEIMDGDPAVQAGLFVYDIHPCRGFPGSTLP
jgi:hypothetical protein